MSHVDEGMLHAYLDGALEEYPTSEARRVRDHLDACSSCRDRLVAERRIRDEAASILGRAVPQMEVPTLEDLRAYARAGVAKEAPLGSRFRALGWAASLVLAVGAGWALRGGGGVPTRPLSPDPVQGAAAPAGPPVARPVEVAQAVTPEPEQARPIVLPDAPEIVAIAIDTSADLVRDDALVQTLAPLDTAPPELPVPDAIVASLDDQARSQAIAEPQDTGADATSGQRSGPVEVVTSASTAAPVGGLVLGRATPSDEARAEVAGNDDTYSLVVPGLPVLDVRFRGSGTRSEGQVALQRLDSGDTLEVIHLPPELDPAELEAKAAGTNELVMRRASGWIVMRAPLDEAGLMELMTRLLAGN